MVGVDPSSVLNFRGKPHVDARTGDIIFIAYRGLRFIPCRVKRGALKRLAINSVPTEEELLQSLSIIASGSSGSWKSGY